ncbi:hypothetical protein GGI26_000181 [Coemansia sp. RSA 1358]|uniref:Chitin-binding type-4 domain-containing protein n=1 Tax=Coemansia umbellata TaxID=1424467 RepID=A0ABQ8PV21_9FUNG|nr:hypothetical protein BX070DRAFT_251164 [Coemansia spiralis]KAJ1996146.1 hypothetical protein EDC05_000036 [Coemansia umbellata]KAJ2626097.1 hypothetical protein GGI26_000181 [Coemansia sp. RSA 1358]
MPFVAFAHMDLISPCPRYNAHGIDCPELPPNESTDWSESSPISSNGVALQPLCKYTVPWPTPAATWSAGQIITVEFATYGTTHSGGHCQWSISYDGGKTFVVLYQALGHCFYDVKGNEQTNYTFALPADLPNSDHAVFAWTWVNAMGNREFYMNCADVAINGSKSLLFSGPQMTILNYPGYPTVPEFLGNYSVGVSYYENAPTITVQATTTETITYSLPQSSAPTADSTDL